MTNLSTPLQGMHNAEARLDQTASRIARVPFQAGKQPPEDRVDLSAEMVKLLQARKDFKTNMKVAQTQNEMLIRTLSLIA
jgi:flagellar basal body rod protein FlgB